MTMILQDLHTAPALTVFSLIGITTVLWGVCRALDWCWHVTRSPASRADRLRVQDAPPSGPR